MLLVSVLFSINSWPAAEMFAVLGTVITLGLYFAFQKYIGFKSGSVIVRHVMIPLLAGAICLKSFELPISGFFFLFAFMAFLIWFGWSVIEELPPTDE